MTNEWNEDKKQIERVCDRCGRHSPIEQGGVLTLDYALFKGTLPLKWDLCNRCIFHLVLWKGDEGRILREQDESVNEDGS